MGSGSRPSSRNSAEESVPSPDASASRDGSSAPIVFRLRSSRRTMQRCVPSIVQSRIPVVPSAQPSHTPSRRMRHAPAREPGLRTKVAVMARQEGIDPVGSCVGTRIETISGTSIALAIV